MSLLAKDLKACARIIVTLHFNTCLQLMLVFGFQSLALVKLAGDQVLGLLVVLPLHPLQLVPLLVVVQHLGQYLRPDPLHPLQDAPHTLRHLVIVLLLSCKYHSQYFTQL